MKRLPAPLELILFPAAGLYAAAMRARNVAFDLGWKQSIPIGASIVSIGNLTAGGTGKTPLTAWLVERLVERGKKVGIVSRGYGGTEPGPALVPTDATPENAKRFGDEPSWYAQRFSSVPVVVARDRVAAVRSLLEQADVDVVLADDAFQHRRLSRSIDIVVLDATEPKWHYRSLPLGRMREGFGSLSRASIVCITKANVPGAEVKWLRDQIAKTASDAVVVEFDSRIKSLAPLGSSSSDGGTLATSDIKSRNVVLASAIGRPKSFEELVSLESGAVIKDHVIFPDHHEYSESDFAMIAKRAEAQGAEMIIVTEKDATKMSAFRSRIPCWVARLEMCPRGDLKEFYEVLDRSIF